MNSLNQIEFIKSTLQDDFKIEFSYDGSFNRVVFSTFRKKLLLLTKDDPYVQRKIFYIFVELAQNVAYYSSDREFYQGKDVGKGAIVIGESPDCFYFTLGNVIKKQAIDVLEKKCKIINSLNRDSLREFKRQQRNLIPGTNGGAHIGLIMVSLTTRKKLDINIIQLDETFSYFSINVKINKT